MNLAFEIVSPVDGSILSKRPYADKDAILLAAKNARTAFADWRHTDLSERAALLRRFLNTLEARRDELADAVTWHMGRPRWQADEFSRLSLNAEYMIKAAEKTLSAVEIQCEDGVRRFMQREPLGVCLSICAWNYPVAMASSLIFAPLLAGNSVLFKHATQTSGIADFFADAFKSAGAPEGIFQTLEMTHGNTAALIESGKIQALQFIGSNRGGRMVAEAASSKLMSIGLELGGKDPAYIRSDVSPEKIVAELVEGSFGNAGQSCCSVERIYVHRDVYDDFLECFAESVRQVVSVGAPFDGKPFIGPVVSETAATNIKRVIDDAVQQGARPILPNTGNELGPAYVSPQILADADQKSAFMQEETFGPVVGVIPVDSDDEAIALMNDSKYGLTASIWTNDINCGLELGRKVESGTFYLNRCDHADPNLTWGGVKESGIGRSYGEPGFEDVTAWRSFHLRPYDSI